MSVEAGLDFLYKEVRDLSSGAGLSPPSAAQGLFKYISLDNNASWSHLEKTLNLGVLTGSSAASLNDPFELEPTIFNDLRDENYVEQVVKSKHPFSRYTDEQKALVTVEEATKVAIDYIETLKRNTRIISFSSRFESPLLWAHYANSYKGACLHFIGGQIFGFRASKMSAVSYQHQRSLFPISLAYKMAKEGRYPQNHNLKSATEKVFFFEKAKDWEYEAEYRRIYDISLTKELTFERRHFLSIICGPRMPRDQKDKIRDLVLQSDFPTLPVLEANISPTSFQIEVDWRV